MTHFLCGRILSPALTDSMRTPSWMASTHCSKTSKQPVSSAKLELISAIFSSMTAGQGYFRAILLLGGVSVRIPRRFPFENDRHDRVEGEPACASGFPASIAQRSSEEH